MSGSIGSYGSLQPYTGVTTLSNSILATTKAYEAAKVLLQDENFADGPAKQAVQALTFAAGANLMATIHLATQAQPKSGDGVIHRLYPDQKQNELRLDQLV